MFQLPTETELNHPKGWPVGTVYDHDLEIFSKCWKGEFADFCDPISNMLGAESVNDPNIKVVHYDNYYNFALVTTYMQSLYHMVQTRSNLLHLNDGIHLTMTWWPN